MRWCFVLFFSSLHYQNGACLPLRVRLLGDFFLFFFLLVGLFLNRNRLFSPPSPASKEFVFALSQHLTGFQSTPNNLVALPSRTEEGREQVSHAEIQVYVAISTHTHTYREDEAV